MYSSDRASNKGSYPSVISACLLASVCCAAFGAIYECFSHGVYSLCMMGAFAFPLLFGALPFFLLWKCGKPFPGRTAVNHITAGFAALTVGSIVQGVLEIYGTTNSLSIVYPVTGCILLAAGLIAWITGTEKSKEAS